MTTSVATVIVGILSLIGTLIGSYSGMRLMTYRIEQLEVKVDKYATATERIPIIEEQIKIINRRLDDLERKVE